MFPSPNNLRIFIVARDPLARAGLAAMLAGQPGFAVVGQASGGADLPQTLDSERPDAVVWDMGWDPSDALDTVSVAAEDGPPILALVAEDAHAAEAWAAGVRGLLPRAASAAAIAAALQALVQGLVALDPSLAAAAFAPRQQHPATGLPEDLTPRERQVLGLLAEGLPNKAIADRLGISDHTVKFHINAIMGKLGAQSRTEAVVLATRLGLITM